MIEAFSLSWPGWTCRWSAVGPDEGGCDPKAQAGSDCCLMTLVSNDLRPLLVLVGRYPDAVTGDRQDGAPLLIACTDRMVDPEGEYLAAFSNS